MGRDRLVCEMALELPTPTLREIGERFGLTREYVRQIIKRNGLVKPKVPCTKPTPTSEHPNAGLAARMLGQGYTEREIHRYCAIGSHRISEIRRGIGRDPYQNHARRGRIEFPALYDRGAMVAMLSEPRYAIAQALECSVSAVSLAR